MLYGPKDITAAKLSTKCSAQNARKITWEKLDEPTIALTADTVLGDIQIDDHKRDEKTPTLISEIDFGKVEGTRYNGQWQCKIEPSYKNEKTQKGMDFEFL